MKKTVFLFVALATAGFAFAQKGGPALFSVDGDTVWGAEFERVFSKNEKNPDKKPSLEELEENRELYVRFKLKVKEAYRLGMDTNADFKKELAGYRKQLAQPYLTDKSVTNHLIEEAYERMKQEVEASNLMIHLSPNATPADTLAAWKRINHWRDMILSGERTFEQITRDSSTDDHGRKHEGRLGFFTAFSMIYPFENQAYKTKIGEVSVPFRTQYGYHILKVTDKRKSRGDLKVAHILIRVNNETEYDSTKPRIDALYSRLKDGEEFNVLVKEFSEDFSTRENGGRLNWIKSVGGGVPTAFKEAAYALKDGEFSEPVKTELGWHIIKRLEEKPLPTLDEAKEAIKFKIGRDSRSQLNKEAVLVRIKEENGFDVNEKSWNDYLALLNDTSMLYNWIPGDDLMSSQEIFRIGNKIYTYADFSEYARTAIARKKEQDVLAFAKKQFEDFSTTKNFEYEESILESKNDDFKYLMQEYRDGILLFELTNKMVWKKASEDTAGLRTYFNEHRDSYQWGERIVTKAYACSNKKAAKKVKKMIKKGKSDKDIITAVNANDALALNLNYKTYEKGQDEQIDKLDWSKSMHKFKDSETGHTVYLKIDSTLSPGPKELNETLGPVTSDYQNYLEGQWIDSLKERYTVEIFEGSLNQLFADRK